MSRDKQIDEMAFTDVDILANDINQHCADLAENYCGDTHCVACLAHALTEKGYRKSSEVAEEIFAEIEKKILANTSDISGCKHRIFAELKKKYIGKDTNVTTNTEE